MWSNKIMINSKNIVFDENLEFYISLDGLSGKICIIISDALEASEEKLSENYKSHIADFLNSSSDW